MSRTLKKFICPPPTRWRSKERGVDGRPPLLPQGSVRLQVRVSEPPGLRVRHDHPSGASVAPRVSKGRSWSGRERRGVDGGSLRRGRFSFSDRGSP